VDGGVDNKQTGPGEKSHEAEANGGGLQPGTVLGKYRIIERIGRGGMGVVYRAEHADLGMLRALKTLVPDLAHHPLARSRFLKEARAAARINHPHVVKIFDTGEYEGIPFFVMEHLEGEDLESAISRSTLTVEQIAGITLAICAAIAEMHDEGIIHRDLKPGNIFLARDKIGEIVPTVLDFGIARAVERGPSATRTREGVVVGTPHYISPEQLADLPAGEQTDQYALGVVLYRCATGALPFTGETTIGIYNRIIRFQFARPRELRRDLSAAFEAVILRMMSERPGDRFPSMYEVGKALLPFAAPRHRIFWRDYYGRVRSPVGVVTMQIPIAGSGGWLVPANATSLAEPFQRVVTEVLPLEDPGPEDGTERRGRGGTEFLREGTDLRPPGHTDGIPVGGTEPLPPVVRRSPGRSRRDVADRQPHLVARTGGPFVRYLLAGAGLAVLATSGLLLTGGNSRPDHNHKMPEARTPDVAALPAPGPSLAPTPPSSALDAVAPAPDGKRRPHHRVTGRPAVSAYHKIGKVND
jgi:hypothetical protein